jgi:hypothetical protein
LLLDGRRRAAFALLGPHDQQDRDQHHQPTAQLRRSEVLTDTGSRPST